MKTTKILSAIFAAALVAGGFGTAHAQFEGLINKAKKKVDKAAQKIEQTTQINPNQTPQTSGGESQTNAGGEPVYPITSQQPDYSREDARWDLFKCKPQYTSEVNEAKLREVVEYNVNGDYGNGGLIVFTKQPLAKKNATLADSVMTFKAGEPIYLNVVLKEPKEIDSYGLYLQAMDAIMTVGDTKQCASGSFKYSIYADYGRFDKMLPQNFALDFQPAGGKSAKYQQQIKIIAETLRKLPPGVHIVPVRLNGNTGGVAVGAFYYDNRDGKVGSEAIEIAKRQITMPKSSGKFSTVERGIVAELNKMPGGRALRAVVIDTDWTPTRHEISGALIGRAITAVVAIRTEEGDCFRETQVWSQGYNGSGYVGLFLSGTRDREDMACENVPK